jgi:predicted DNA-binding transcriptional regulator AlpA
MQQYLLRNFSELAQKRAVLMREEAQLWDILARDLKREAGRREEAPVRRVLRVPVPQGIQQDQVKPEKLFVRVSEAMRMMGLGRSTLYAEIACGRLKVRKSGRKTIIAVADIQDWFQRLPERQV